MLKIRLWACSKLKPYFEPFQKNMDFSTTIWMIPKLFWTGARTTDTQSRHKSEISEKLGRCGIKNMLWPYLRIWDWDWIFGRAVKAISSLGVRSPWTSALQGQGNSFDFLQLGESGRNMDVTSIILDWFPILYSCFFWLHLPYYLQMLQIFWILHNRLVLILQEI